MDKNLDLNGTRIIVNVTFSYTPGSDFSTIDTLMFVFDEDGRPTAVDDRTLGEVSHAAENSLGQRLDGVNVRQLH